MDIVYENAYGSIYRASESPCAHCNYQLVVNTVGVYMSKSDLSYLLQVVTNRDIPAHANSRYDYDRIWCKNPLIDIHLKVEGQNHNRLIDLLKGALFNIEIEILLKANKININ